MFVNWLLLAWRKTFLFLYKLTLCNQRQQNSDVLSQLTTENNILPSTSVEYKMFPVAASRAAHRGGGRGRQGRRVRAGGGPR